MEEIKFTNLKELKEHLQDLRDIHGGKPEPNRHYHIWFMGWEDLTGNLKHDTVNIGKIIRIEDRFKRIVSDGELRWDEAVEKWRNEE